MSEAKQSGSWIVAGTTLLGIAVGMLFLRESALIFLACLLGGIGSGLLIAGLLRR